MIVTCRASLRVNGPSASTRWVARLCLCVWFIVPRHLQICHARSLVWTTIPVEISPAIFPFFFFRVCACWSLFWKIFTYIRFFSRKTCYVNHTSRCSLHKTHIKLTRKPKWVSVQSVFPHNDIRNREHTSPFPQKGALLHIYSRNLTRKLFAYLMSTSRTTIIPSYESLSTLRTSNCS